MSASSHDPRVQDEPHMRGRPPVPDPSEVRAAERLARERERESDADRVEHSVWDEPGAKLGGPPPPGALTYASWLAAGVARTGLANSWGITALVALAAAPWAILGTLLSWHDGMIGVAALIVVGPVVEEMLKVALPLWIVEKRPYLFRSRLQIATCALASGGVFATVENLLYLHVYIAHPSAAVIHWRWTVCTAMHMGCSLLAGIGLMSIWRRCLRERVRPRLATGARWLVVAMVIHGTYNGFAVLVESVGFSF